MNRCQSTFALACIAGLAAPLVSALDPARTVEEIAAADHPATPTYSVVNLGTGYQTELPKINNRGQVAFNIRNYNPRSALGYRALFYDGATIRDRASRPDD